jgi:hypothetical protein
MNLPQALPVVPTDDFVRRMYSHYYLSQSLDKNK